MLIRARCEESNRTKQQAAGRQLDRLNRMEGQAIAEMLGQVSGDTRCCDAVTTSVAMPATASCWFLGSPEETSPIYPKGVCARAGFPEIQVPIGLSTLLLGSASAWEMCGRHSAAAPEIAENNHIAVLWPAFKIRVPAHKVFPRAHFGSQLSPESGRTGALNHSARMF